MFLEDFLKVLRFSFPVPVVGPSAKDFYPLQHAKFTRGIFLLWVLSNHERFYWCVVNQTRSCHMKLFWSKLNWNVYFCRLYFDFFLSQVIKYKALVGVLSSYVWVLYQGRIFLVARERKNIIELFFFLSARTTKIVFLIWCFLSWSIETFQRARNVWRLNSHISQEDTFVHYPRFVLNIPLFTSFTFSYRKFFPLFVCFNILWELAATHVPWTQVVRAKMTSLDVIFCRGNKSSSRSLVRFCRRKH